MTHDFEKALKEVNEAEYERADYSVGLPEGYTVGISPAAYEAVQAALQAAIAAQNVAGVEWECFCDEAYYHLWAVRPVGDRSFNSQKLYHVQSKNEAESLRDLLNSSRLNAQSRQAVAGWLPIETLTEDDGFVLGWFPTVKRFGFICKNYMSQGIMEQAMLGSVIDGKKTHIATHWKPFDAAPDAGEVG